LCGRIPQSWARKKHGGHCELREFDDLEIADENRLMNIVMGLGITPQEYESPLGPRAVLNTLQCALGSAGAALDGKIAGGANPD
jgi:hypothetical protein